MCTVTFVPTGPGSYILTSNRDESPQRITEEPGSEVFINEHQSIVFPKDMKAGGTWIAESKAGRTVCLLNGAFIKHHHNPPYRKSRGLILLDYFNYTDAPEFAKSVDLDRIEPFTMILVEDRLYEFRWDGENRYFKELSAGEPHIWSSATLYSKEVAEAKKEKFLDWFQRQDSFSAEAIMRFHGVNNPDGFLLDLEKVKTVSITSVTHTDASIRMIYHDLLTGKESSKLIPFIG
jgi:hypothetical protein